MVINSLLVDCFKSASFDRTSNVFVLMRLQMPLQLMNGREPLLTKLAHISIVKMLSLVNSQSIELLVRPTADITNIWAFISMRSAHVTCQYVLLYKPSVAQTADVRLFSSVVTHLMRSCVGPEPTLILTIGTFERSDDSVTMQFPMLIKVRFNSGGVLACSTIV